MCTTLLISLVYYWLKNATTQIVLDTGTIKCFLFLDRLLINQWEALYSLVVVILKFVSSSVGLAGCHCLRNSNGTNRLFDCHIGSKT